LGEVISHGIALINPWINLSRMTLDPKINASQPRQLTQNGSLGVPDTN